ncbi:MAG: hypothetical protein L3V56_01120 [Candidatus Magnetoovum sp. WYHC-5]|nr:hypothetical protein [Candidatus Magnetoovum sp. WYHC-5]
MIEYSIVNHTPGHMRINVPIIKKLTLKKLKALYGKILWPDCFKDVSVNPLTGNIRIKYEPKDMDIKGEIDNLLANTPVKELLIGLL